MKAPFPYFGGKALIARTVLDAFGPIVNYVEPFAGSLAVLLSNPNPPKIETVNDMDCYLTNLWRAIQFAPNEVAKFADWPVVELDLHARGNWIFYGPQSAEFRERMRAEPDYFDAKMAGWWLWGQCAWIGGGWGYDEKRDALSRKRPHLGDAGMGVHRKRPHLMNAGKGINRVSGNKSETIFNMMSELSARLRNVRICCGDWSRVLGPSVTFKHGLTGVFLDPPYSHAERDNALYAVETDCAADVRQWCVENGSNPLLRIVLCGYDGEHNELERQGWSAIAWKANGGYALKSNKRGRDNAKRERLWLSPYCVQPVNSLPLFAVQ